MPPDLYTLISETLNLPAGSVNRDSTAENTRNWDSLRQMVLMSEIETAFGVEFTAEELSTCTSVVKIIAALERRGVRFAAT
jgi:acyl carrier protein